MPSSARALASGPQSTARPETSFAGELERQLLRLRVVAADERVLVAAAPPTRFEAASECRPATTGASSSSWIRFAIDVASAVGFTPPGPKESSAQTESTGVEPIVWRRSRAVSTAASALTASRTRSTPRTASSFGRPLRSERRRRLARALRVARADHDLDARVDEALRHRLPEAARPADDRDPHAAAPSTVSASRRDASRSVISVCVTILPHGERPRRVGLVDDERVDQARVAARHVRRSRAARHPREHTVCRAFDRAAADERADRDARHAARDERRADLLDREDRPDAHVRVGGRDHDRVGPGQRLEHARSRARLALEANGVDLVAVAARDEPLLEREAARGRVDPGPEPVVRRRHDRGLDPERLGEPGGHRRERLAGAQRLRAHEVEPEVAVAEPEPVLAAERGHGRERLPGLARAAPASFLVVQAGERVEDAVEVGRDGEAEHVEVVAHVPDHGHVLRIDGARRGRVRSGRRRHRRRGARPSQLGEPSDRGLRARSGPEADPRQVLERVDVV